MKLTDLRRFLLDSNLSGYASGKAKNWVKNPDGSTTITFSKGDWRSEDHFYGGEPYGGRTIVFYQNKPVWIMVYYGRVERSADPNRVYSILRQALLKMPSSHPFRGPSLFTQDGLTYTNSWEGSLKDFSGQEQIAASGSPLRLYQAKYLGGLVDQHPAL
jgi:hypothetical protein